MYILYVIILHSEPLAKNNKKPQKNTNTREGTQFKRNPDRDYLVQFGEFKSLRCKMHRKQFKSPANRTLKYCQ